MSSDLSRQLGGGRLRQRLTAGGAAVLACLTALAGAGALAVRMASDAGPAAGGGRSAMIGPGPAAADQVPRTSPPERTVRTVRTTSLSPGDDQVVGVGQPIRVVLDRAITGRATRTALERRLTVTTTPAVTGAWRWMSDTELHFRAAAFWAPATTISLLVDLEGLELPDGTRGAGRHSTAFTVGDALTSTVDVAAKTMTVARNGQVLRVLPASMGAPGFDTRAGTFVVLEKFAEKVLDSDTLALPAGAAPYRLAVRDAVRITNSGTFTHSAPWSLAVQGSRNVSHGCINLSPQDADWFYQQTRRGDIVTVINSPIGPIPTDAGSQDWNMSFEEWQRDNAHT